MRGYNCTVVVYGMRNVVVMFITVNLLALYMYKSTLYTCITKPDFHDVDVIPLMCMTCTKCSTNVMMYKYLTEAWSIAR